MISLHSADSNGSPGGTIEYSPEIHRWEWVLHQAIVSLVGTADQSGVSRPYETRRLSVLHNPVMNDWAKIARPYGAKIARGKDFPERSRRAMSPERLLRRFRFRPLELGCVAPK